MITDHYALYTLTTSNSKIRASWPQEATSTDIATGLQSHCRRANAPTLSSSVPCISIPYIWASYILCENPAIIAAH